MRPQYSLSDLRTKISDKIKGTVVATIMNRIINDAARDVFTEIDLRSAKRKVMLSVDGQNLIPSELNEGIYGATMRGNISSEASKYNFHCPIDMKGTAIIDIRSRYEETLEYEMTDPKSFLRRKTDFGEQVAVDENSNIRQLLVSGLADTTITVLHNCDTVAGNGTWIASGIASAAATETSNYVEGAGAVTFAMTTGAGTGYMTVTDFTDVDISGHTDYGVYLWLYIPMATDLTSVSLAWGNDSSNYYSRTVTKTHDNSAFFVGYNLLRFPINDATETGTVDDKAIDYLKVTIIKGASNTGTSGWIIDRIAAQEDSGSDVVYYSKYPWQTTAGVYMEASTGDTDLINVDVDELDLVIDKACELLSDSPLDHQPDASKYRSLYLEQKLNYELYYPSERMMITTTYQGITSIDSHDEFND